MPLANLGTLLLPRAYGGTRFGYPELVIFNDQTLLRLLRRLQLVSPHYGSVAGIGPNRYRRPFAQALQSLYVSAWGYQFYSIRQNKITAGVHSRGPLDSTAACDLWPDFTCPIYVNECLIFLTSMFMDPALQRSLSPWHPPPLQSPPTWHPCSSKVGCGLCSLCGKDCLPLSFAHVASLSGTWCFHGDLPSPGHGASMVPCPCLHGASPFPCADREGLWDLPAGGLTVLTNARLFPRSLSVGNSFFFDSSRKCPLMDRPDVSPRRRTCASSWSSSGGRNEGPCVRGRLAFRPTVPLVGRGQLL